MEYNIVDFVNQMRDMIYTLFPFESDEMVAIKHSKRPLHIRDIAFMWLPTSASVDGDMISFDIGSEYAEENYPYYHILQQAPVIRKRGKGTTKTRGSQNNIKKLGDKNYERVSWNGKIFSKEYSKNVRGSRSNIVDKSTQYISMGGQKFQINKGANSYKNIHYKYIDNILDIVAPELATMFGLSLKRKQDTGLEEEYNEQYKADSTNVNVGNWGLDILDIMQSFDE